jgi:hypothetical protein
MKQRDPMPVLERADGAADRGLREAKGLCCACHVLALGDNNEYPQLIERHVLFISKIDHSERNYRLDR